jgi:aminoglycoside/choline kinase family phosphotransferase
MAEQVKQRVTDDIALRACRLLGADWSPERVRVESMGPDGSLRRFCRLVHESGRRVVAIAPPPGDETGLREARSGHHIGCHLFARGAPVPEQLCFDEATGLQVCEDLGDVRLHDLVTGATEPGKEIAGLYRRVVEELARMQVRGRSGFDPDWCWDAPRYDRQVMLERESGYFLQAMCRDLLDIPVAAEVHEECAVLADHGAAADNSFFLHRDFQSRNIMVRDGRVFFIDFQAGRLGPLAYDLASLLIDPYVALPASLQQELQAWYLDTLAGLVDVDRDRFYREYQVLAIQRNLQILGAFAFLSHRRHKKFFRPYMQPALQSLAGLLAKGGVVDFPALRGLVRDCRAAPG